MEYRNLEDAITSPEHIRELVKLFRDVLDGTSTMEPSLTREEMEEFIRLNGDD